MKPEIPQLDPDDMPDPRRMTPQQLEKVPSETWKLFCCVGGCRHFTRVKDYGIWPLLAAWGGARWININLQVFFCNQHHKMYRNTPFDQTPFKESRFLDTIRKTIMEEPVTTSPTNKNTA